jgi:dolichol-phosphate mannosyltransferase
MSFRERHSGDSKLDFAVEVAFANMLIDKTIGRFIPRRFLMFSLVGGSGVFIHLAVLKLALVAGSAFALAQGMAAFTAMTTNFLLNNTITFSDKRLHGWALLTGLLSFYLVCSVGLVGNIGVADFLFKQNNVWWLSGLAGALVSAVWNYAASSLLTWRQ